MLAEEHSSATPVSRYSFVDPNLGDSPSAGDSQNSRSHHSSDEQIYKPFTITSTDVYISPTASPIKKFEKNSSAWSSATPKPCSGPGGAANTTNPSESCGKQPENGVSLHICSSALGRVQAATPSTTLAVAGGVLAGGVGVGAGQSGDPEGILDADSGMESAASSWDRSVAEVKELAFARLQDELRRANEELKLRDEEVTRLSRIRQEVESELEDLTASLFQEAHKMVREANIQQAAAERSLKEKAMQVDVLTAEVSALKTLVLTSTPSRPNLHLMQNDSRSKDESDSQNSNKLKKHRRCPSHFNLKYGRENSPPDSPTEEQNLIANLDSVVNNESCEVDPVFHKEFLTWKQNPTLEKSNEFIARIYREDIDQCLDFNDSQLAEDIRIAVDNGDIFIEAVSDKMKSPFAKKCVLFDSQSVCNYRLRLSNSETWYYISQICRNRITAVCNFLNYLRYIQRGLVKSPAHDIYWEIIRLRKEMMLARLGLSISQS